MEASGIETRSRLANVLANVVLHYFKIVPQARHIAYKYALRYDHNACTARALRLALV